MAGADAAVDALATTCDKYTDHSNYWCPQLYQMQNDMFSLVKFTGANMYYENQTCSWQPNSQHCNYNQPRDAQAFPPGFRMIAGDTTKRTYNATNLADQAILFTSGAQENVNGIPTSLGSNFQIAVRFPSCWDGKNVDSANHKDHVSYPDPALGGDTAGGMCPESHPVALLNIGAEFGFDITGITDPNSLVFANGDSTGYGFHGDFIQGWTNSTALQESFANCFDNDNCPWRAFGSPGGKEPNKEQRDPEIAPVYEEEVGLNGPLAKLPGNNPVYGASIASSTSTTTTSSPATTTKSPLTTSSVSPGPNKETVVSTVYVTLPPVTVTSVASTCITRK